MPTHPPPPQLRATCATFTELSQHRCVYGSTGLQARTLAIVWNKHADGLAHRTKVKHRFLLVHFFMVFVFMHHLPIAASWSGQMAYMQRGRRKKYSKSTFWKHSKSIVSYLAEHIDELELTARDDPMNHGTGELAVGTKEIVDTFPFKILSRDVQHQNPKYGAFVLKFQIMITFTGRITRLSQAYPGRVSDARIFDLERDGAKHIILGDKAYIGSYMCLTAKKGRQPYLQRLRHRNLNHHRVRIEHIIGFIKRHGLFKHRTKDWTRASLPFAASLVKIVTHCKSIEIKDRGGRYKGNGPWPH